MTAPTAAASVARESRVKKNISTGTFPAKNPSYIADGDYSIRLAGAYPHKKDFFMVENGKTIAYFAEYNYIIIIQENSL